MAVKEREVTTQVTERPALFKELWPIREPYAYAALFEDSKTGGLRYAVIEPSLIGEEQAVLERIEELLVEELDTDLRTLSDREKIEDYLCGKVGDIARRYKLGLGKDTLGKLMYYIVRDYLNYGKIDIIMRDHSVEDVSCDGPCIPIYIWHREYESIPTNIQFDTAEELDSFVARLSYKSGRHLSIATPMIDASLPEGSRIQLTYGKEITRRGSTFSIRKFKSDPITISDLILFGTITADIAAYFWFAVENKASILLGGATAAGKTTALNCLSMFIQPDSKIVSIEDTAELNLPHENWIPSIARPASGSNSGTAEISLYDLLKAAVRQRPDYIIVGEVRGSEAYTLFQAMAVGHGGLGSIHADSVTGMINRLENEPMNIPRALIPTLNTVAIMNRTRIRDRPARRVRIVSEIVLSSDASKEIEIVDLCEWDPVTDSFRLTNKSPFIESIKLRKGIDQATVDLELSRRRAILEWMAKSGIRSYRDVAAVIRSYYMDPAGTYNKAKVGLVA